MADEGALADVAPDLALGLKHGQGLTQVGPCRSQLGRQLAFRRQAGLGGKTPRVEKLVQMVQQIVLAGHRHIKPIP